MIELVKIYKGKNMDLATSDLADILDKTSWNFKDLDTVLGNLYNDKLIGTILWIESEDKIL